MNRFEFEQMCRDASLELGLADTAALGSGFTVAHEGVLFEAAFREGHDGYVLLAELGSVDAENKLRVFESMLTLQVLAWTQQNVRFGFNPDRQTAMLCVAMAAPATGARGELLAMLMHSLAEQAAQWRTTLLVGAPHPSQGDGPSAEQIAEFLADCF